MTRKGRRWSPGRRVSRFAAFGKSGVSDLLSLFGLGRVARLRQAHFAGARRTLDGPEDADLPLFLQAAREHDLQAPARAPLIGEEDALLDRDGRRVGAERPTFAVRQHQQNASLVGRQFCTDARMHVKADRVAAAACLRLGLETLWRGQHVLAADQQAIRREQDTARIVNAEAGEIALMGAFELEPLSLVAE